MNQGVDTETAIQALRDRGVDQLDELLETATPEEILSACQRWDQRKASGQRAGTGLLVHWIKNRQFSAEEPQPRSKGEQLRAIFDEYAKRYPVGAVTESHRSMIERRWPDDLDDDVCQGQLVVIDNEYPSLAVDCDGEGCDFTAAYPPKGLQVLGSALRAVPAERDSRPHRIGQPLNREERERRDGAHFGRFHEEYRRTHPNTDIMGVHEAWLQTPDGQQHEREEAEAERVGARDREDQPF